MAHVFEEGCIKNFDDMLGMMAGSLGKMIDHRDEIAANSHLGELHGLLNIDEAPVPIIVRAITKLLTTINFSEDVLAKSFSEAAESKGKGVKKLQTYITAISKDFSKKALLMLPEPEEHQRASQFQENQYRKEYSFPLTTKDKEPMPIEKDSQRKISNDLPNQIVPLKKKTDGSGVPSQSSQREPILLGERREIFKLEEDDLSENGDRREQKNQPNAARFHVSLAVPGLISNDSKRGILEAKKDTLRSASFDLVPPRVSENSIHRIENNKSQRSAVEEKKATLFNRGEAKKKLIRDEDGAVINIASSNMIGKILNKVMVIRCNQEKRYR